MYREMYRVIISSFKASSGFVDFETSADFYATLQMFFCFALNPKPWLRDPLTGSKGLL